MDGLFFLMSVIGIGLVMWWAAQNDRAAADKPTTGLFAMRDRAAVKVKKSRRWLPAPEGAPGEAALRKVRPRS